MNAQRACRVPVPVEEPLIGSDSYDYADAFEIELREPDARSPEQLTRCALEQGPWPVRWTVWIGLRHVLRLKLGPRSSPDHVFGWTILTSRPEVIHLEAVSPLLRGVLVLRRPAPTVVAVTTYVRYTRAPARFLWTVVGPLHRRVARYLLEYAAAPANQTDDVAAVR